MFAQGPFISLSVKSPSLMTYRFAALSLGFEIYIINILKNPVYNGVHTAGLSLSPVWSDVLKHYAAPGRDILRMRLPSAFPYGGHATGPTDHFHPLKRRTF